MCGFVALLARDGHQPDSALLVRMTHLIAHRGPDDHGFFLDGSVGLGFRRLSILDLAPSGHQPMTSADGRHVIVFNGEIYNYVELREELLVRGHNFRSTRRYRSAACRLSGVGSRLPRSAQRDVGVRHLRPGRTAHFRRARSLRGETAVSLPRRYVLPCWPRRSRPCAIRDARISKSTGTQSPTICWKAGLIRRNARSTSA